MNRAEFIHRLSTALHPLSYEERSDILKDYADHFDEALRGGKTEEEICSRLGSPEELAATFLEQRSASQPHGGTTGAKTAPPVYSSNQQPLTGDKTTTGILIVVISCFLGVIAFSALFGLYATVFGIVIGLVVAAIALISAAAIIGTALAAASLICIAIALLLGAAALVLLSVVGTKYVIRLIKWYISCCKRSYETGVFTL